MGNRCRFFRVTMRGMGIAWYAGLVYLAIGAWPAVGVWFALRDMHPVGKLIGLLLCMCLWPLALLKRRGGPDRAW